MTETVGHFRKYVDINLGPDKLKLVELANKIINEYESAGYAITLRQLYYQFVARGLLENSDRNYDKLGGVINDGRMTGLISWTAIEDRQRILRGLRTWEDPIEAIKDRRNEFLIDKWRDQEYRVEVHIEKDALLGVIGGVCQSLGVDYISMRGYQSQSTAWRCGQRLANYVNKGQKPVILHLGDHDPSGIDMTRDNRERISLFTGTPVMYVRLALNMDQVEQYDPPPNPAKLSDSRARAYIEDYGDTSWELDAIPPDALATMIEEAVLRFRDDAKWSVALAKEAELRDQLDVIIEENGGTVDEEDV